jgi:hypothetical protein
MSDFFNKTIVTEEERLAYHNFSWLTGNLISMISEVDISTVHDSTTICFESYLIAGLGLPPYKFLSWLWVSSLQPQCHHCPQLLCNAIWMLVGDRNRYQLVLVFLFFGPIHQYCLFWDRVVTSSSPQSAIHWCHLQELLKGLSEEVIFGGYACWIIVGEQASIPPPPAHQRQKGWAVDDTVLDRSGQAGGW